MRHPCIGAGGTCALNFALTTFAIELNPLIFRVIPCALTCIPAPTTEAYLRHRERERDRQTETEREREKERERVS